MEVSRMNLKKFFALFLSVVFFFSLVPLLHISGFSEDNCEIILQYTVGQKQYLVGDKSLMMDSEPEIKDSRMHLVIRFVLQNIPGTKLDWDGVERKITIRTQVGNVIKLWIGNPKAEVNGKLVDIDPENPGKIAPYIKDGRTKVPMRFVGEQLNARIDWISATSTVILTLFDTFNCDTTMLEGCISKWTEAPNNLYQIYFHKLCDLTKESVPYMISKTLKSKTDQMDLAEYFQLKSATKNLNTRIWVTLSGKVLSWDPIPGPTEPPTDPKPPEPPDACCNYQLSLESQPIAFLNGGESSFYEFILRNHCSEGSKSISFQFAPISNISSINPKQLVLPAKQEIKFKVFFTMPLLALKGTKVKFTFKIEPDCSEKVEQSFMILCDTPHAPPEPEGKKGRILGTITGTCNPGVTVTIHDAATGKVVWTDQTDSEGKYDTSPTKECILKCPGSYKVIPSKEKYIFTEASKIVTFTENDCCNPESIKLKAKVADFTAETTAKPGRIIAHLGQKCNGAVVTIVNVSNPLQEKITLEANIKGSCDTGCSMIYGDTYRVTPKSNKFKFNPSVVEVKIKDSCPDAITHVSFEATDIPPSCCDWEFRVKSGQFGGKWTLFPGDSETIEVYEIKNNCANKLNFKITWPEDGKISWISPTLFSLEPNERQTLSIKITMPKNCEDDKAVFFPFYIATNDCEKTHQIVAFCKKWQCNDKSVILKVQAIDQRVGWVDGILQLPILKCSGVKVRIYFQIKSDYWKKLEVGKCFEICYEEKNDASGELIKWGIDYRLVNCPD